MNLFDETFDFKYKHKRILDVLIHLENVFQVISKVKIEPHFQLTYNSTTFSIDLQLFCHFILRMISLNEIHKQKFFTFR